MAIPMQCIIPCNDCRMQHHASHAMICPMQNHASYAMIAACCPMQLHAMICHMQPHAVMGGCRSCRSWHPSVCFAWGCLRHLIYRSHGQLHVLPPFVLPHRDVAIMFTAYEVAGVFTNLAAGMMGEEWRKPPVA